jgi:PAS domain S-box-containing protein
MRKLKITTKLTLIFIVFAIAVLLGISIPSYLSARETLRAATVSELHTTSIEKQAALNSWVVDRQESISDIANQAHLRDTLTAFLAAPVGSLEAVQNHADMANDLGNWAGSGHRFLTLEVIDAISGRVIVSINPADEGKFREDQPYFTNGLLSAYVQNPYFDLSRNQPVMTASAPITAIDGKVIAVMAGPLDMTEMNAIIQRRSGLHQTDESYLINTSHLFVTQPRLVTDPAVLQLGIHSESVNLCLNHKSGVIYAADYRNIPAIVNYRWLPERQLCLISKIDQSEAYAPSRQLALVVVLISGLVLLVGSVLAVNLARGFTRPLRQLVEGAEQIGQGNLEHRIQVSSGDEIGKLGIEFNEMAASIGEKDRQLRKWSTELENRVNERTVELQESEERYRTLAETSPEMIFVLDKHNRIKYVNQQGARQFGKSPDEIIGKPNTEVFPPDVTALQETKIRQVLKTGKPYSSEDFFITLDGRTWLETQLVPMRNSKGEVVSVMGLSRDVTERKNAEETLRETKDYLDNLITYANAPIITWDTNLNITRFNRAFERLTGYESEKVLGKSLPILFPPANCEESLTKIGRTSGGEFWESVEIPILCQNGETRIALWNSANLYAKDGTTLIATIAQGQDITGRKLIEDQLKKTLEDLARSNTDLERFAYVSSHDLQEPLRMVTSYLQLLERRYKDKLDDDAQEFIKYAVDGSNRMKGLINDLLAFSRVGSRKTDFVVTDVKTVLDRALNNLKITIGETRAKVTHDPLPKVLADETQLESLFQNLISNAIKFRGKKSPRIHIGVKRTGEDWVFSVKDNGIGIDPQYFERVFIIFQRLHSSQEFPGTGIGLAISKRIVDRHGGRIWIESELGKGSTFYFSLPFKGEFT